MEQLPLAVTVALVQVLTQLGRLLHLLAHLVLMLAVAVEPQHLREVHTPLVLVEWVVAAQVEPPQEMVLVGQLIREAVVVALVTTQPLLEQLGLVVREL